MAQGRGRGRCSRSWLFGQAARSPALGAFFGHLYPVWLRFRGGKGVATLLGHLIGFALIGGSAAGAAAMRSSGWACSR